LQLAFTTVDELARLLEEAGEPLDYREFWPRLFPVANCPPDLMRALVADIVDNDERFAWESSVRVGLVAWRSERRDLADVSFTVVDLETTGATPGFSKITEVGAVRIEGGEIVGAFSELVDPGVPIPALITGITGITREMVEGAPAIDEVLPRFVDFAADSVLVAHNARFDLAFLDYELGMLTREAFPRPALDTLRLARRLMPHTRCSLGVLAERLGLPTTPEHRALADARATGELLLVLLSRLEEQNVTTLEEVAHICEPEARRNYHKIVLTEQLPTAPGVYIMRDARGAALYIGKAENLRRRTRDHFLQRQAYGATQALELLEKIDIVETGSEFAALLLENRLIRAHRPPCNRHGTRVSTYHYVKLTGDVFPRLYATPNLRDDGSLYVGPFRKAAFAKRFADTLNALFPLRTCVHLPVVEGSEAEQALQLLEAEPGARGRDAARAVRRVPTTSCIRADIGHCLGPCRVALDGQYRQVVEQARRVLEGDGDEAEETLKERQDEAVEQLAFEQAGRLQAHRDALQQALRLIRRLHEAHETYALLVYPSRRAGRVNLYGVAAGRIVVERELAPRRFDHDAALAVLRDVYGAAPAAPPLPTAAIDELLLVHSWLRAHRHAVNVLSLWRPQPDADDYEEQIADQLHLTASELLAKISLVTTAAGHPDMADDDADILAAGAHAEPASALAGAPAR
jgi:DNA polymerase III subunit epsilon